MRRQGEDLGAFPLEELRRRRETGELTGNEYVQGEGKSDWQPLDLVLQLGYRVTPPPLPSPSAYSGSPRPAWVWAIVALAVVFFICICTVFVINVRKGFVIATQQLQKSDLDEVRPAAMAAASRPVVWTTNTLTRQDANRRAREFRIRQWLDGYEQHGAHNPANDAEIVEFIRTWIARNYGGAAATNQMSLPAESDKLAADVNCTDPLALTVVANESPRTADAIGRFERALAAYPGSQHKSYPQFYATVVLGRYLRQQPEQVKPLDSSALELLPECFADGSFTPDDQQEIAEIFVNGWGNYFFARNATSVCAIVHDAGPDYRWLALTLDGEREITEAWAARGGGYASTVSATGWQGFNSHLASARSDLTAAWKLQPGWPVAPERMIYVSLGDSDITEMRLWFDRTTTAQIDYPRAWSDFRWGLRPRWYGNEAAMLALGKTALATGRFDTDVPREFVDCVYDVESEMNLPAGQHIFGRSDIWPDIQRVYDGYIREAQPNPRRLDAWRTAYAIVASFAGKYDVARTQLEAMNWEPDQGTVLNWNLQPALWPLEVAARTGPLGAKISAAEALYKNGDSAGALKKYTELNGNVEADARTKEFIRRRLDSLGTGHLIVPRESAIPGINGTN